MPEINVEVIFCPNESFQGEEPPLEQWPRVPGVTVSLTHAAKNAAQPVTHDFPKTGSDGFAGPVIAGPARYDMAAANLPALWTTATASVLVTRETKLVQVILIPDQNLQLVPWQLTYDDPATGSGPLPGAQIQVTAANGFDETFESDAEGHINSLVPIGGNATVKFGQPVEEPGTQTNLWPPTETLTFPVNRAAINPQPRPVEYAPEITLSVSLTELRSGQDQLLQGGAVVTLTLSGREVRAQTLGKGEAQATFGHLDPGKYRITVVPAAGGLTLIDPLQDISLQAGDQGAASARFRQQPMIMGRIETEDGKPVTQDVQLQISGTSPFPAIKGKFDTPAPDGGAPLTISVVAGQKLEIAGIPLLAPGQAQSVVLPPGTNVIKLTYEHAIKGRAIDEQGKMAPNAMIDIFDKEQRHIGTVETGPTGQFTFGVAKAGDYFMAQHPEGDMAPPREKLEVHSNAHGDVRVRTGLARTEAMTDLSAYPVLTEEISTMGPTAPASGGPGGSGTDYGQVIDQAMRDVLGWRPGGDGSGFQAALTGAFQLREVEGHTEWTWQQRGYAVQADMGALTGAQASIYARAKSALDQILPLLTGLTPIDPALYPPQDLEAIRTVVVAEISELVNELALEGGPRIERVDELFGLLLGDDVESTNMDPDMVQGQLGTLRDRFGLTVAYVDTVDEERIVTNYRIVVEQVLALQASWNSIDRALLSVVDENSSLGTVLVWLSRGLEAVCESVSDLTFALDSVFVDAAQRQVIELKFGGQPPLLLSDLLDWVVRACQDEGPRMIQDSGKDGVTAFAPVLRKLLSLVQRTWDITRPGASLPRGMRAVPDGLRTPRVSRAFQVLASQLKEAARLAGLVQRGAAPAITKLQVTPELSGHHPQIQVTLTGVNFRKPASAFLFAANREDIADVPARRVNVKNPSKAVATFRARREFDDRSLLWQVVLVNEDGTPTEPTDIAVPRLSDLQ